MSTKALRKELLAAIAMVIVAAIALSGSTYAWFALNNEVTATGMNVRTETSDNLLIAADTLDSTAKKGDSEFKTSLIQNKSALLEPVSTIDGENFFYNSTKNTSATGAAIQVTYAAYNVSDTSAFNTNYDTVGAEGYVDYVFQLKAINGKNVDKAVVIDNVNLTYGTTDSATKAFRVAVFAQALGTDNNPTAGVGTLKSIIKDSSATNFTPGKAVDSTSSVATVLQADQKLRIGDAPANQTVFFKVVVRLWLEGEDTTCNNETFAKLTDKWALDVHAKLENSSANNGAQVLTNANSVGKVDLTSSSASNATVINIDGVDYYIIGGATLGGEALYTTATGNVTNASKIYTIIQNHPYDVTNQMILPQ